jgi:hypothetical protein
MIPTTLSRPDASEYKAYYHTYVDPIADQNALELLSTQKNALEPLRAIDESRALYRYAPGKWSVKEVIGHVTDAERIFSYRLLRIGRGDKTPLASFDQEPYIDTAHFDRFPITDIIDAFRTTRDATLSVAGQIDEDGWPRTGTASDSPVSARALAYIIVGHASHHFGILRDKYGLTL